MNFHCMAGVPSVGSTMPDCRKRNVWTAWPTERFPRPDFVYSAVDLNLEIADDELKEVYDVNFDGGFVYLSPRFQTNQTSKSRGTDV